MSCCVLLCFDALCCVSLSFDIFCYSSLHFDVRCYTWLNISTTTLRLGMLRCFAFFPNVCYGSKLTMLHFAMRLYISCSGALRFVLIRFALFAHVLPRHAAKDALYRQGIAPAPPNMPCTDSSKLLSRSNRHRENYQKI